MRFLVLGPLEVLGGEGPISLRSAKQRRLLAALLAHVNTAVSVDRLGEILWGDALPADAAATLQNYVSRLRALLEPGRAARDPATMLLTRAPGYLLRVDQDQVDASRFERLVAEALRRAATGELPAAGAALDDALVLWRGRAYAEFADDDFARTEALRLEELRRLAVDERVEANLSLGRHRELIGELEGIVAADPLRERPRAQLMLALYRCGREAEALRTYQQHRRYLADELGIEPSPALRQLEEAIILQKSELDWTPGPPSRDSSEPAPARREAPAGTAEILVTDGDRYTRLWEEHRDAGRDALARHDARQRDAVGAGPVVVVPKTRYAKTSDGVHIAYQVAGDGPLDVVMVPGFVSHVELAWTMPFYASMLRRVGSFARVVLFDKRGTGLSDRTVGVAPVEQRMDDVRTVMNEVGIDRAALWGISEGGPMCMLFAATYPDRTSGLVLQGSFARLSQAPDYPFGYSPEVSDQIVSTWEERWGTGWVLATFYFLSAAEDPGMRELFARWERNGASPSAMVDILLMIRGIDVRSILPTITVPTLVVHSAGDAIVPVEHGRYLAEHIPGARYLELPGNDHLTIRDDERGALDDIEEFLTGQQPEPNPNRVLATLVFVDIVDSARRAAEGGADRWREMLNGHDEVIRREIERFRGREMKATAGGFIAAFDGPARAVQCALAVTEAGRRLGLELRVGVHTGECEQRDNHLAGIALDIAAQVAALAQPGQVLASRTVTDLVVGSRLEFADCGEHQLKGVPGRWHLFAVQVP